MSKAFEKGGNPYMPLWEHVPDGEPRVFKYNGEERVYLYGSHDILRDQYCGQDYVVWSAPVDNLSDWKCHGVCFEARNEHPLYAPDVVQVGDTFYMFVAENRGGKISVATSKNPAGPFTDPMDAKIGFDPGVLVDDDGRIYAFWGFCGANAGELEPDMLSVKEGTYVPNPIGHCRAPWSREDGAIDTEFGFFEASSPRKILGKYVLIYSKNYNVEKPELGVIPNNNGFLSYAYSDKPLSGYVYGGDISFNGGEIISTPDGNRMTYQWGNNHGSLMEVNGKWYIFYHRQTGLDEYSRQAMVEPVDVALDKNGRLFIGRITYENGEPVKCEPVEMTSQGAVTEGLDAFKVISAGRACHIYDGQNIAASDKKDRPYIKPVYEKNDTVSSPIVNITRPTTVGFRYLNFDNGNAASVVINAKILKAQKISVRLDSFEGPQIASLDAEAGDDYRELTVSLNEKISGKHAVYICFSSAAEFDYFYFK